MHFSFLSLSLYEYSLQSSPPIPWRFASRCCLCLLGEFVPDFLGEQVRRFVVEFFAVLEREAASPRGVAGAARCRDEVEMDVRDDLGVSLLLGATSFPVSGSGGHFPQGAACDCYSRWRQCSYPVVPLLRCCRRVRSAFLLERNKGRSGNTYRDRARDTSEA